MGDYSPAWQKFMRAMAASVMRRRFAGVVVSGLEQVRESLGRRSAIFCPNHTNWWDGFAILQCTRMLDRHAHRMIQEEQHLRRYPFFRWAGLFGLDLRHPREGLRTAESLLEKEGVALWIFPQGAMVPEHEEIKVRRGSAWLAGRTRAAIVPVGLAYVWGEKSRPLVRIAFGEPLSDAGSLESEMRRLYLAARDGRGDFKKAVSGRAGFQVVWDRMAGRKQT